MLVCLLVTSPGYFSVPCKWAWLHWVCLCWGLINSGFLLPPGDSTRPPLLASLILLTLKQAGFSPYHFNAMLCFPLSPPQSFGSTIQVRPDYSKSYLYLQCIPLSLPLSCLPTFLPHLNHVLSFTSGHCRGEVPTHTTTGPMWELLCRCSSLGPRTILRSINPLGSQLVQGIFSLSLSCPFNVLFLI